MLLYTLEFYDERNSELNDDLKFMSRINHLLCFKMKNLLDNEQENLQLQYQNLVDFFQEKELSILDEQNKVLKYIETNFTTEEFKLVIKFIEKSNSSIENDFKTFKQKVFFVII